MKINTMVHFCTSHRQNRKSLEKQRGPTTTQIKEQTNEIAHVCGLFKKKQNPPDRDNFSLFSVLGDLSCCYVLFVC